MIRIKIRVIFIFFLLSTLFCCFSSFLSCPLIYASSFPKYKGLNKVRVLLDSSLKQATITTFKPSVLLNPDSGSVVSDNRILKGFEVAVREAGLSLNKKQTALSKIRIIPQSEGMIEINDQIFRGSIDVVKRKNRLNLINTLTIENYLVSVVTGEMSQKAPLEALKAQAVAARTYTLYSMLKSRDKEYDLNKVAQCYKGVKNETSQSDKAVNLTKGEIMIYGNNEIFPSFFHSVCGGATEYAGNVWKGAEYPLSVKCPYCKGAEHFGWRAVIDLKEIKKKLKENGYKVGDIQSISRHKVSKVSDRVTSIRINSSGNRELTIRTNEFRNIIGADYLRSTNFLVRISRGKAVFDGFGWGHGVGMCQAGAIKLAEMGWNYKKILQYYYPGVRFTNM